MGGPKSCNEARGPGMRVLIVDDNRDTARMMQVLLKARGYEAKVAFGGREALDVAASFRPDVVLLDLTLPDLSGYEVAEELRGAAGFEGMGIVAISGYESGGVPATFDGHFGKPVDHDALNRFLSRWASGGGRTLRPYAGGL